jgi:nitrile hydratase
MNGIHDMGGMHGFGPIIREENEPPFHEPWERRVFGMQELTEGRSYTIDAFRFGIERMAPAHYLRAPYYERWLASIEHNLILAGILTSDELEARTAFFRQHPAAAPPPAAGGAPMISSERPAGSPPLAEDAARFAVGDAVVTRNVHPAGHTRLPRYARGKRGVIERAHGAQTFPDTNAHGLGANPQPLYSVRFDGRELWGDSAESGLAVSINLWESYLEPAPD